MNKYSTEYFSKLANIFSSLNPSNASGVPFDKIKLPEISSFSSINPPSSLGNVTMPGQFLGDKVRAVIDGVKESIKQMVKPVADYKPDNMTNALTKALPVGAGAGALLGGAYGAVSDPGVDEEGNPKSRLNRALSGAAIGGAVGGTAGALSPLALRSGVKLLGKASERFGNLDKPVVQNIGGMQISSARGFKNPQRNKDIIPGVREIPTVPALAKELTDSRLNRMKDMSVKDMLKLLASNKLKDNF